MKINCSGFKDRPEYITKDELVSTIAGQLKYRSDVVLDLRVSSKREREECFLEFVLTQVEAKNLEERIMTALTNRKVRVVEDIIPSVLEKISGWVAQANNGFRCYATQDRDWATATNASASPLPSTSQDKI